MSNSADSIDASVIRRIADGDRSAFEALYDAFSGPLFSLALRILSHPEDAEDLLQEVFAKLWKDAANYDSSRGAPLAWAFTVTRNKAIDRIRSRERRTRLRDNAELAAQSDPPPKPAAPIRPRPSPRNPPPSAAPSAASPVNSARRSNSPTSEASPRARLPVNSTSPSPR